MAQEELEGPPVVWPWGPFVTQTKLTSIDVPYNITIGYATIVGAFHLREPFQNSSTDGAIVGAVSGSFHLDQGHANVTIHDPSGNLLRVGVDLNLTERELTAHADHRTWNGHWHTVAGGVLWRC